MSKPRIYRYKNACKWNENEVIHLYMANLRLSQQLFGIISLFEVILRNRIDSHYKNRFEKNWLQNQCNLGGFFQVKGCETSRRKVLDVIFKLGANYTHDKTLSDMNFGFWKYQFGSKEFAAAGSTLLVIFPNLPRGHNNTSIFKQLDNINKMRNRIAHHEPLCFQGSLISIEETERIYLSILTLFQWLDIDISFLLDKIDFVNIELEIIKKVKVNAN